MNADDQEASQDADDEQEDGVELADLDPNAEKQAQRVERQLRRIQREIRG